MHRVCPYLSELTSRFECADPPTEGIRQVVCVGRCDFGRHIATSSRADMPNAALGESLCRKSEVG